MQSRINLNGRLCLRSLEGRSAAAYYQLPLPHSAHLRPTAMRLFAPDMHESISDHCQTRPDLQDKRFIRAVLMRGR